MNRDGHLGVAVAAYSPIGFVAAISGFPTLALLGAGLAAALSTLPDIDTTLPFVRHRGYSHTVWFALLVAVPCAALGARVGTIVASVPPSIGATLAGAVGATTVCSHIAADALTPMGVRPFAPFGRRRTLGFVRASNRIANRLLLVSGVGVLVATLWIAARPG